MANDLFWARPEPDGPAAVLYQHTVLAQTCLPYRDPGAGVRLWQRAQGAAHLEIEAGRAFCPDRGEFVDLGITSVKVVEIRGRSAVAIGQAAWGGTSEGGLGVASPSISGGASSAIASTCM
jgi:hypothetical protein